MTREELSRQIVSAVLGILLTGLLLSHYATHFDSGELMVLVWLCVFAVLWIAFLHRIVIRSRPKGFVRTSLAFVIALFLTPPTLRVLPGAVTDLTTHGSFVEHERACLEAFR